MKRRALSISLWLLAACCGCASQGGEPAPATGASVGEPVQFSLGTIDGQVLSSDTTRGRTTALLFVTTYDLPSQAEAQLLRDVLARHRPLANAAIVMMEAPRTAELARVWADSISVKLPIAMASPTLMSGDSELGRIVGVPTLVVLDRSGRLRARLEGAVTREELEQALRNADAR